MECNNETIIFIDKINEAKIKLSCSDSGVLQEISEHFTFFAEGYKFHPLFKNKLWDGKIRLFNIKNNYLPFGLLYNLIEFLSSRGYKHKINFSIKELYPSKDEIINYINSLEVYSRNKKIIPHNYQIEGISNSLSEGRKLLISPTGSGKSLMIYFMIRWFLSNYKDKKILIIVPTTSLVEQMYKDFCDYSSNDVSFNPECLHRIYFGKEKLNFTSPIVITTWQSAIKLPPTWFLQFGMVIGDEAHLFKAKSLVTIMDRLVNCFYRIGTTGTLDGSSVHEWVLNGVFGPTEKIISTKELMDSNILSDCKIKCILLKYNDEERKLVSKMEYQDEIEFIINHHKRNNFIINLALDQNGNTLVLYHRVEKHGIPLFNEIRKKADKNRKVFFVSASVETTERERIRELIEKEKNAIIVASMGTFSTGINIRNLHFIIFASPTKSQIKVLQSIGRGLRKSDDGRPTIIYDICDDFSWKRNKNYSLEHSISRINIYSKEKFNHQIFEVPF